MENLHQKLETKLHLKHSKEFSVGQVIFKEGDKIEEGIYYVLNGEVEIFKDENYLVKIAQGNFGGLCDGLLLDKRMETARAGSGGVRIVFFSEALFEKLLHLISPIWFFTDDESYQYALRMLK